MVIFAKEKILKIDRKPMTNSVSYLLRIIEDKSLMIRKLLPSTCHLYPSTRILSLDENVNMIANDYKALLFPNFVNKISLHYVDIPFSRDLRRSQVRLSARFN